MSENVFNITGDPYELQSTGNGNPPTGPTVDLRINALERQTAVIETRLSGIETTLARVDANTSNTKLWAIGLAVAVFLGIGAINIAIVQSMFGAFESGKATATLVNDAKVDVQRARDDIQKIVEDNRRFSQEAMQAIKAQHK